MTANPQSPTASDDYIPDEVDGYLGIDHGPDYFKKPVPTASVVEREAVARLFHDTYERLAPSFGYETRADTKTFDPASPNGQLMIAVCGEVADAILTARAEPSEDEHPLAFSISAERHRSRAEPDADEVREARPPLPKGTSLFAVNCKTDEWFYINHAKTWQPMPNPILQCSCGEVCGEDPHCALHGRHTEWGREHAHLYGALSRALPIEADAKGERA